MSSWPDPAPDFYALTTCDAAGWGGGLASVRGVAGCLARDGLGSALLGVAPRRGAPGVSPLDGRPDAANLVLPPVGWRWRIQDRLRVRQMSTAAAGLPAPTTGVITSSVFWIQVARALWPETLIVYLYPCLLSRCLPLTRSDRRSGWFERSNQRAIDRVERAALATADLVLAPSQEMLTEVRSTGVRIRGAACSFGATPPRITADAREARRAEIGAPSGGLVALAAGVMDANKSFEIAVWALARLPRDIHLVLVGDGPGRSLLAAEVERLQLGERVHLRPPQEDLSDWYAAADCVLSMSRYESFGLTLAEAMHAGRPVVVPRHQPPHIVAGLANTIGEARAGLHYTALDYEQLAATLTRLWRDDALRRTLGHNAEELARDRFDWEHAANEVRRLLGRQPRRLPADGDPGAAPTDTERALCGRS